MGSYRMLFIIVGCCIAYMACDPNYLPKPRGYNRIILPPPVYQNLVDTLPYSFQYSQQAKIYNDTSWISERYWIHVYYPDMKATIQITYKEIQNDSSLYEYWVDAYNLTAKHNIKASAIEERILVLPSGMQASFVELKGEVPSQAQFHVTDSVHHFLRGALYFQTATKNDSLAPVIKYIKSDIIHLLETLKWKHK